MTPIEQLREEIPLNLSPVLYIDHSAPETTLRIIAQKQYSLGGHLDPYGNPIRFKTDELGSYVISPSVCKVGVLKPFRELPEYRSYIRRHTDRLPTEELLAHVFQYRVTMTEGLSPVIEIASFSPEDRFTVNGEPYEPPPFIPEYRAVREGGSIQYMVVTDVGKRAYRADTIVWVDIEFPSPPASEEDTLFASEIPAQITIITRS